jgi:hypothetical protein
MLLEPEIVELSSVWQGGGDVLLPCRGAAVAVAGATTWDLDQRPPRQPWTLLGCARSHEIHRWFYGNDAPGPDTCPRRMPDAGDGLLLTKCCLLEDTIEAGEHRAVVPWGASLRQIEDALRALAAVADPSWQPA